MSAHLLSPCVYRLIVEDILSQNHAAGNRLAAVTRSKSRTGAALPLTLAGPAITGCFTTVCFPPRHAAGMDTCPGMPDAIPHGRRRTMIQSRARFHLGQIVRHRKHPFRGVVFDVDPVFSNTEDWYRAIPEEARPRKDQPFYHLLAENGQSFYVAYVSEQNLVADDSGHPVGHPDLAEFFGPLENGHYPLQVALN
jgi:heat shock protein HspQ